MTQTLQQKSLKLNHIYKTLGDFQLKDIHIEINPHEYFVILGPTGTGKTVLLETIAGMYAIDSGEIWLGDINMTKKPPEERRFGFVYQDYALFPHLNVKDNISFGLKAQRCSKNEIHSKIEEIVSLLHIEPLLDREPYTLSGGEQQRVSLARALVTKPEVLLLDEPLSALDPNTKENLQYELKQIQKVTKTVIIHVTHDFEEAMYLADRIAVMNQGEILQVDTPEEIFNHPNSMEAARFVTAENIFESEIMVRNGKKFVRLSDYFLEIQTPLNEYIGYSIRPEYLSVNTERLSAYSLRGKILSVQSKGLYLKIIIDVGEKLTTWIDKKTSLPLTIGSEVYCDVDPEHINTFPVKKIK